MANYKVGEVYEISFWDHSRFDQATDDTPYLCRVVGVVSKVNKNCVVVYSWTTFEDDGSICKDCTDGYVIMRSTIEESWRYERTSV